MIQQYQGAGQYQPPMGQQYPMMNDPMMHINAMGGMMGAGGDNSTAGALANFEVIGFVILEESALVDKVYQLSSFQGFSWTTLTRNVEPRFPFYGELGLSIMLSLVLVFDLITTVYNVVSMVNLQGSSANNAAAGNVVMWFLLLPLANVVSPVYCAVALFRPQVQLGRKFAVWNLISLVNAMVLLIEYNQSLGIGSQPAAGLRSAVAQDPNVFDRVTSILPLLCKLMLGRLIQYHIAYLDVFGIGIHK
jgi:hypothetical protein